jgi:hypothetical protein
MTIDEGINELPTEEGINNIPTEEGINKITIIELYKKSGPKQYLKSYKLKNPDDNLTIEFFSFEKSIGYEQLKNKTIKLLSNYLDSHLMYPSMRLEKVKERMPNARVVHKYFPQAAELVNKARQVEAEQEEAFIKTAEVKYKKLNEMLQDIYRNNSQ